MAIPKERQNLFAQVEDRSAVRPIMRFQLDRPESLSGAELDRYLANGWYRQGQGMFSTYSTISRKILMAAPWIRMESDCYTLSKNLRRVKNRNDHRLTHHISKAFFTPHRESMFQEFRLFFKGEFYESLESALFCYKSQPGSIFDTYEITFYLDEKLIGYSYFDVGENSIASILNIYDSGHTKYSLGMYSILLQLEWCQANGKRFYYPGYAMPENPRFDYKLRIGGIQFLDQATQTWQPWNQFRLTDTPLFHYREAMIRARERFFGLGLGWNIGVYLNHSNPCPMLIDQGASFLSHPIFLSGDISNDEHPCVVDYDLESRTYRLFRCTCYARPPYPEHETQIEEILFPVDFDVADFGCIALLTQDELLCQTADLFELYEAIAEQQFTEWNDEIFEV